MSLYSTLQELAGSRYTEAHHAGDMIDNDLLRTAQEGGVALPTAGDPDRDKYHGAVVFDPEAGLHRNVMYPDFSSLYPRIMIDINSSLETIVGVGQGSLLRCEYDESELRKSYIDPRPVKQLESGEDYNEFTHGEYKMVYDPEKNSIKWRDDWERVQQHLEPIYFEPPEVNEGIIPSRAETYIRWNKSYSGTMYDATKRVRNCFTPDTEVMTPRGIVNIRDLDVGDTVYSIDPDSLEVEEKPVTEVHEYPDYDGELVDIESDYTDLSVTPNHRLLLRQNNTTQSWDDYRFVEAGDVNRGSAYQMPSDWSMDHGESLKEVDLTEEFNSYEVLVDTNVHGHTFASELGWYPERTSSKKYDVTSGYKFDAEEFEGNRDTIESMAEEIYIHSGPNQGWIPSTYAGDNFLELMAWFITEGSCYTSERCEYDTAIRGECTSLKIAQEGAENGEIRHLFDDMGLPHSSNSQAIEIGNELLSELMIGWCGSGSESKKLPEFVFDLNREQKQLVFDTLIKGDGDSRSWSYRYTTSSDQLRDDVMRLAMHLGRNPRYTRDSGSWRVFYGASKNEVRPLRHFSRSESEDGVYCVTVEDNHTLLAGRNGKFQWVGQSLYGVNGDSKFRLFDWRVAEAITIAGRLLLEHAAEVLVERLVSSGFDEDAVYVTHGDTDGFGLAVDMDTPRSHILPRVRETTEWLNDEGIPEFVEETFNVPDTGHELEIESYAPKLFVPADNCGKGSGIKKTYAQRITWDEGEEQDEMGVKGFECVRSDVADVTAELQEDVLEIILYNEPLNAQRRVYERVREMADAIHSGDIALSKVGERSGLSKEPEEYGDENRSAHPVYRGAKYAKKHIDGEDEFDKPMKYPVERITGEYPKIYNTDTGEDGSVVDYISVEDPSNIPEEIVIDYDEIIESTLKQPLRNVLGTMGWSWDEAIHSHTQSGLDSFGKGVN